MEKKIEPKYISEFVVSLGVSAHAEYSIQAGKKPSQRLSQQEEKELRTTISIISQAIAKGLVLAMSQPELAQAFVEQMNHVKPNYSEEILAGIFSEYENFLYYKFFVDKK